MKSAIAPIILLAALAAPAFAMTPTDRSRPFDQYSWVTTHNAFTSNGMVPNQNETMAEQLNHGVRGLMLDLHDHHGRVSLCHKNCSDMLGTENLAEFFNETLLPFLAKDPNAIVSLHLEDFTDDGNLEKELARVPHLAGKTFDPSSWQTEGWPTYEAMVKAGQRVLIFSLKSEHTGAIPAPGGVIHIMPSEVYTVENYWSLGNTQFTHDYACRSRWSGDDLSRRTIAGKPGWRPLFTMNHFHGLPLFESHASSDNDFESLQSRYLDHCLPAAGRKPNFVAVDFYEKGDVAKFADWLTLTAPDKP